MKILSVVVPTYNMESLLPRCLDSLVSSSHIDILEVIVVNDGSRDGSLEIARRYEQKYPDTVIVIDKPNGNYGSTINAALPLARGKYFRILDSDDKYDTDVLNEYLEKLVKLDSDMVVTHFTQWGPGSKREVIRYNTMGREIYDYGREYILDDVLKDGYIRFFLMHSLAYKTELLREMGYHQTEGVSYTDTEFASYPVFYADTVTFLNLNLYQYFLDREGQTMNPSVLMKSVGQMEKVIDCMVSFFDRFDFNKSTSVRKTFLKHYYENRLKNLFKLFLLDMPRKEFNAEEFERVFSKYQPFIVKNDLHIHLYPENKILHFDYIPYWQRNHRRWPRWFEGFNALVDVIVKRLYVLIFRR